MVCGMKVWAVIVHCLLSQHEASCQFSCTSAFSIHLSSWTAICHLVWFIGDGVVSGVGLASWFAALGSGMW